MSHDDNPSIHQYGRFLPEESCFLLEHEPPKKWVNLHFNQPGDDEAYFETTNIGDGHMKWRDHDGNGTNLVSYDSKYLFIRDDADNTTFSPWGCPAPTDVTERTCRYYPWQTVTAGTAAGLRATQRVFVPRHRVQEIWTVTLENLTDRPRNVSVFGYAMFQLDGNTASGGGGWKDNHSRVEPDVHGVLVYNRARHAPHDRYKGYLVCLDHFHGASGYRDYFTRADFSVATPKILWGWNADNQDGVGPDCAGIVQAKLELAPGATARVDFLLGPCRDKDDVARMLADTTPEAIDGWVDEQKAQELEWAGKYTVTIGRPHLESLINQWSKHQMVSYLINKSGFRDNLQNDMGVSLFDYPMARANLLRALASQYADGSVPHGFRPLNDKTYADKPAWILQTVPALVRESGEFGLLDVEVPYFRSAEKGTVWDHMLRAMRYLANDTGENGLCDQHFADWNDGLEPSEQTGARESVMVTQQLAFGLLEVQELARRRNEPAIEKEAADWHVHFTKLLNDVAWDGRWYRRTLCGSGFVVGSDANEEAKIFVNPQSWAVLSQTAINGRAEQCMAAVDEYIERDVGFSICAPGFTKFDQRIGKFSASRPGHAENGGCYNHAAGFKGLADCMLGRAEQAWRTFIKVCPDSPENPVSRSQTEPFSFTNCYMTLPEGYGRAHYPWRTGTCNWFNLLLVEWILGARRHYDGLLIDPCLSKEVSTAGIVRTNRGARYEIEIDNTAGRCKGVRELHLNGKPVEGDPILRETSGTHQVKVVI
ncbi:MAG: GH36-type glycosyl hydrolase domain-containing protein [Opitutales bacterium]